MARRPTPPKPETPVLSPEQTRLRIEQLQHCIRDLEAFDPRNVQKRHGIPEVMALEAAVEEALAAAFGDGTPAYNRYARAASLDNGPHTMRMGATFGRGPTIDYDARDAQEARRYLAEGKQQSIALLGEAIKALDQKDCGSRNSPPPYRLRLRSPTKKPLYLERYSLFTVTDEARAKRLPAF